MKKPIDCLKVFLLGVVLAGAMPSAQAAIVFNDTFEPDGETAATRNDDAFDPLDMQWRPRLSSQASLISITNDAVSGNCLRWAPGGQFFLIGQFDDNAADGVSMFPTNETHTGGAALSLGESVGDKLRFTMEFRTTTTLASGTIFAVGLQFDPDGPIDADLAANTWGNDARGYFIRIPNGAAGTVPILKESGDPATSPLQGGDTITLVGGVAGQTAAVGANTNPHTLMMEITRTATGVLIDVYWDGALKNTIADNSSPYVAFNSIIMQAVAGTYLFDNVKMETFLSGPPPAKTWIGTENGAWTTGGNWDPSALVPGEAVIFNSNSTGNFVQNLGQNWHVAGITVSDIASPMTVLEGFWLTNSGGFNMSAATADVSIRADYTAGGAHSVGAGRILTLSNVLGSVTAAGPGTVRVLGTMNGGVLEMTNSLTLLVEGGSLTASPPLRLTAGNGQTVFASVTGNGSLSSGGNGARINLGNAASTGTNILTLESGTIGIAPSANNAPNGISVAAAGTAGILNINDGVVALTNKQTVIDNLNGETSLTVPGAATGHGVVRLNGGRLIVPMVDAAVPTTGSGAFYFNGGVMQANRSNNQWMQGLPGAFIQSAGAVFDTAGYEVTIGQSLLEDGSSPGGGLTKLGGGILTLTGGNNYTGPTMVNVGTLVLGAAHAASGGVTVADGAALGFQVSEPQVTVAISSAIIGSTSGGGLMAVFSGQEGNPNTPAGFVTNLTLHGTVTVHVRFDEINEGTIPLVSYGSLTGGGTVTMGYLPAGVVATVTNNTELNTIELIVTEVPLPPAPPPPLGSFIFEDTFRSSGGNAATRHDDPGPGYGLDVQWRPRLSSQANLYSVVNDAVFGNALQFNPNGTANLFILAQFDGDAADGINTGGIPTAALGPKDGDKLRFSMDMRTTTEISGGNAFKFGLYFDPDGPVTTDPAANTWANDCFGYFISMPNGTPGMVSLWKESGDAATSPLQGSDSASLSSGISGATAAAGVDTQRHKLVMELTRAGAGVQISVYWDGTLVNSATDNTAPYTTFNTFIMQYGPATTYVFDNVKLETSQGVPSVASMLSNGSLVLKAENGMPGRTNYVLTSTNVALPRSQWTRVRTNVFDALGRFNFTNAIDPASPQRFYLVDSPVIGSTGGEDEPPPPGTWFCFAGNTHSHTSLTSSHGDQVSSGDPTRNGLPAEHYSRAKALGYDFYVTTDHSQEVAFDPTSPTNPNWVQTKQAATDWSDNTFVAFHGVEHSENNGPDGNGHYTVINSPAYLDALESGVSIQFFYNWLKTQGPDTVAGFNHPGSGSYNSFAYRDAEVTDIITLLEVINSNTSIHYSAFLTALNLGWKVSPTCGNDNHGFWGIGNHTSRAFVVATNKSKASFIDAMKNRRTYAAMDSNIRIIYTVNGHIMGSTLNEPTTFNFDISVNDPDVGDINQRITRIDIMRDGGATAQTLTVSPASHSVSWQTTINDSTSRYFFLRVYNAKSTSPMAWVAPVWTGR